MLCYMARNKCTGSVYVGITRQTLQQRRNQHHSHALQGSRYSFHRSLIQHGKDAFEWSVLGECEDRELLLLLEQEAVAKFGAHESLGGYNMTTGGVGVAGYAWPEEAKDRLSAAIKARPARTDLTRSRLSLALKGRRPSDAALEASRVRMKDEDVRAKISAAKKGVPRTKTAAVLAGYELGGQTRKASERGRAIPLADYPAILAMRSSSLSLAQIAEKYRCNKATVSYYLKRMAQA
jgi:hypothetical protein